MKIKVGKDDWYLWFPMAGESCIGQTIEVTEEENARIEAAFKEMNEVQTLINSKPAVKTMDAPGMF